MRTKEIHNFLNKNRDSIYPVFRVVVALLFMQHGAQKLFGLFGGIGGSALDLTNLFAFNFSSLLVIAGFVEFFGGLLIVLGLFTRTAASLALITMIGAWFLAHFSLTGGVEGWVPILNKGELALFYLVSFLYILFHGAGKWALDNKLFKDRH
ncbi:DoxX family protein [Candidatus Pacearchaeota archaeon]|nr:DoxX family protein [Candidatus Pacearchaeota archaeon]